MTREELIALRDAIDATLALPESVHRLLMLILTGARTNGLDHDPPPNDLRSAEGVAPKSRSTPPRPPTDPLSAAERKLVATLRDHPAISMNEAAKLAGAARSSTNARLQRLEARGNVERDDAGRWQLAGAKVSPAEEASARPIQPSPAAS